VKGKKENLKCLLEIEYKDDSAANIFSIVCII